MKKQSRSFKTIKVFKEDWSLFMSLAREEDDATQYELFNKILEEYRVNGK